MAQYSPKPKQTKGIQYGPRSRKTTTPLAPGPESSTTEPSAPTTTPQPRYKDSKFGRGLVYLLLRSRRLGTILCASDKRNDKMRTAMLGQCGVRPNALASSGLKKFFLKLCILRKNNFSVSEIFFSVSSLMRSSSNVAIISAA